MNNEDLKNLIDCIKLEVKSDVESGNTFKTTYELPEEALSDPVAGIIVDQFSHYKSATLSGRVLTLEHPDPSE